MFCFFIIIIIVIMASLPGFLFWTQAQFVEVLRHPPQIPLDAILDEARSTDKHTGQLEEVFRIC